MVMFQPKKNVYVVVFYDSGFAQLLHEKHLSGAPVLKKEGSDVL